jgi:4-hydroxy-tetrahydrodipicolinate reductase
MNIVVTGAAGRMGRTLIATLAATPGAVVSAALEREGSPFIGMDCGVLAGLEANHIMVSSDAVTAIAKADAILDFTSPDATVVFSVARHSYGSSQGCRAPHCGDAIGQYEPWR